MKYLLLVAVTLFFSWPYYHRMRTFGWDPAKSYVIGLLPSVFISMGIVRCIVIVSQGGDFPILPDDLTKWTYAIVCIMLSGFFTWLMFSSKFANDGGPNGDGDFFVVIVMFLLCVAQGFFATDIIITTVRVIS